MGRSAKVCIRPPALADKITDLPVTSRAINISISGKAKVSELLP